MALTTYLFYSREPTKYMRRLDKIIEEEIRRIVENEGNNEVQDNNWWENVGYNNNQEYYQQPEQQTPQEQPQQEQEPQQQGEQPQQEEPQQEQDSVVAWDPNKWDDSNSGQQQDQGRKGRGRIFKTADANEQHAMLQDLVSNVGFSVTAATALAKILQIDPTFSQQPTQNQTEYTGGQRGQEQQQQQQGTEGENWQANQQNGSTQMNQDIERQTSGEPLSSPESQDFIRRLVGDDFTPASNNVNIVYNSNENDQ